jgi:acyl-CoA thioesterase-1
MIRCVLFLLLASQALISVSAFADNPIRIVALGHSLFAAQSGPSPTGLPEQLAAALKAKGYNVTMFNAGVYGDTTDGVRRRLDKTVPEGTDIVILAIGSNDLRKGSSRPAVDKDIDALISRLRAKGALVIQIAISDPSRTTSTVQTLPDRTVIAGAPLPPDTVQLDHPTSAGNAIIVERWLPVVEEVIAKVRQRR